jgi:hypothetical protein
VEPNVVARRRLVNLGLVRPLGGAAPGGPSTGDDAPRSAAEVVRRLGAVQSQEYAAALWSIGSRCADGAVRVTDVESALATGDLIRTHVLRSTWHFVSATDLRRLLALTADRVHAATAYYYRLQGLDLDTLAGTQRVIEKLLDAGPLTRPQLASGLASAGVPSTGQPISLVLMAAELDGVICSGAPLGGRQTYDLIARRVPDVPQLDRDEALAELTWRYFSTHGPAAVADLAWWSSLRRPDIETGLRLVGDRLERTELDGVALWGPPDDGTAPPEPAGVHLVQGFDEYVVGYTRTKYVLDLAGLAGTRPAGEKVRTHILLVDGQVTGHWARTVRRGTLQLTVVLDRPLDPAERAALDAEATRYATFLGDLTPELSVTTPPR